MLEMSMDEIFKKKLEGLRNPAKPNTFAEALFGEVHWLVKESRTHVVEVIDQTQFSEKQQVLNSLERFAQEKIETSKEQKIVIEGGEIHKKPEPVWDGIEVLASKEELLKSLTVDQNTLDICLKNKESNVRVLFVPEEFRKFEDFSGELKDNESVNELLAFFPQRTAELFSRMISAMKLKTSEVLVFACQNNGTDITEEVMKVATFYRPEVIVTLGATSTQKVLKSQERLTQVHGQFFSRKIENVGQFTVVPLFHPSIIENNMNMKKAAWADMQKIMSHLNLL